MKKEVKPFEQENKKTKRACKNTHSSCRLMLWFFFIGGGAGVTVLFFLIWKKNHFGAPVLITLELQYKLLVGQQRLYIRTALEYKSEWVIKLTTINVSGYSYITMCSTVCDGCHNSPDCISCLFPWQMDVTFVCLPAIFYLWKIFQIEFYLAFFFFLSFAILDVIAYFSFFGIRFPQK